MRDRTTCVDRPFPTCNWLGIGRRQCFEVVPEAEGASGVEQEIRQIRRVYGQPVTLCVPGKEQEEARGGHG